MLQFITKRLRNILSDFTGVIEPDEPIPPELRLPEWWSFSAIKAIQKPLVWDALFAEDVLWAMDVEEINPLSTSDGLTMRRVLQVWHNISTIEDVGLMERVRRARLRNLAWRTRQDVMREHLAAGGEVAELIHYSR